jgi:hypothetical protein
MWIIIAVIVVFLFARALNNASKKGRSRWTTKDDLTCQLDEDLKDRDDLGILNDERDDWDAGISYQDDEDN